MRKAARVAVLGLFVVALAYDIGAYARDDYRGAEPVRDIAAGLAALAAVAAVGRASADTDKKGADVER